MSLEALKKEGLQLERSERTELVHFLIDTLLETEDSADDVEISEELKTLLDERLAAFSNGVMETVDGDVFEAELKAKYGL